MLVCNASFDMQIHVLYIFFVQSAFVRTNRRSHYCRDVCLSVCLSVHLSVWDRLHRDHTMHFSVDLSLWFDSPMSDHPDTKTCPLTPCRLFSVLLGRDVGYGCAN